MGMRAVSKLFYFLSVGITCATSIANLIGLYAGDTNPYYSETLTVLAWILPVLIIINAVFVIYWTIRWRIWTVVPLIAVLCSINFIGTMYQFGSPDKENKEGVGIATFNVQGFNKEQTGTVSNDIKEFMEERNIGIICFQEYSDNLAMTREKVSSNFKEAYPYMAKGKADMRIFSKYPIVDSQLIEFEGTNNSAMYTDIQIGDKVVRVVNVHMQTTGINRNLNKMAKKAMAGEEVTESEVYATVADGFLEQAKQRASQSITVSNVVRMTTDRPVILCGDFNDIPYSYTYNMLKSTLEDGFSTCGKGFMYTFKGAMQMARIDYIFHSKDLKGITYYSEPIEYSDHNPVIMRLEINGHTSSQGK